MTDSFRQKDQHTLSKCNRVRQEQLQSSAQLTSFSLHTPIYIFFFILKLKAFSPTDTNSSDITWGHISDFPQLSLQAAKALYDFVYICSDAPQYLKTLMCKIVWGEIQCELDTSWPTLNPVNEVRIGADTDLVHWISSLLSLINHEDKWTQQKMSEKECNNKKSDHMWQTITDRINTRKHLNF